MKSATSFISEHSAEFVLVPRLINILSAHYKKIVPIFFWSTREGGILARESISQSSFRVLAMYPRRPKVDYISTPNVNLKLNQLLFERSAEFEQRGIPVLVGLPLISNLLDFNLDIPCLWLHIHPQGIEELFHLAIANPEINSNSATIIKECDLSNFVTDHCRSTKGGELLNIMRQAKSGFNEFRTYHMFSEPYKPTYILIPDS